MSDLIKRQDAIEAIYDEMISRFDIGITEAHELAEDVLGGLPSADAPDTNVGDINCTDCIKHGGDWECDHVNCHKGKNGRWLMNGERYGHMYWRCSQCEEEVDYIGAKFCPNCGSYNGGEQDDSV